MFEPLELVTVDEDGLTLVEGTPARAYLRTAQEATRVLEACVSAGTTAALLYSSNLPPRFFDVSSLEAGEVLQKLRACGVRLAVVREPGAYMASRRFHELLAAERRERFFDVFESRGAALEWLQPPADPASAS
jgi:hypothetical protein